MQCLNNNSEIGPLIQARESTFTREGIGKAQCPFSAIKKRMEGGEKIRLNQVTQANYSQPANPHMIVVESADLLRARAV